MNLGEDLSRSMVAEAMYAGELAFARRRYTRDLDGVDMAVVGIPFDQGTSNRPGARFGPRAIREQSSLVGCFPWARPMRRGRALPSSAARPPSRPAGCSGGSPACASWARTSSRWRPRTTGLARSRPWRLPPSPTTCCTCWARGGRRTCRPRDGDPAARGSSTQPCSGVQRRTACARSAVMRQRLPAAARARRNRHAQVVTRFEARRLPRGVVGRAAGCRRPTMTCPAARANHESHGSRTDRPVDLRLRAAASR